MAPSGDDQSALLSIAKCRGLSRMSTLLADGYLSRAGSC